ncbi:HAD family hydrolase [Streptomyces sp. NPDC088768]|uniref:HAD family hydrolase n=1 Tax=Streptomyces sp. NPDC088768 TaxID=3365894 RepID=UPI003829D096
MELIVLWDIDHTLVENAGVSKEIYAAAFRSLVGRPPSAPARTEGRTDRLIMSDLFRREGLGVPDWDAVAAALTDAGADKSASLRARGHALPGAAEALKAVSAKSGWLSSVLTGNIAANACVKLSAFGLDSLLDLPVGAYGADADHRADLVGIARIRARAQHGTPADTPVVLVGDTPRDVEAALSSGSAILAVASGIHDIHQLRAAGARHVLPDLTDTTRVLDLLSAAATPGKRPGTSPTRP